MAYVVISYDLHVGNDTGAYGRLDLELRKQLFDKAGVDTVWTKSSAVSASAAVVLAKGQFMLAASAARIENYDLRLFSSEHTIEIDVHKARAGVLKNFYGGS